jgi:hypothetical protein
MADLYGKRKLFPTLSFRLSGAVAEMLNRTSNTANQSINQSIIHGEAVSPRALVMMDWQHDQMSFYAQPRNSA